jgi:hypothetical protein
MDPNDEPGVQDGKNDSQKIKKVEKFMVF